jgi:Rha family phage regulatory protein
MSTPKGRNLMNGLTTLPTGAVFRRDGKPMTTSKQVADLFGKQHKDVLRDIDRLLKIDSDLQRNFAPEMLAVPTGKGGTRYVRSFAINQRGAALLIMGFTGAEALRWKQKFLDAFDHLAERENDNHKAFLRSMRKSQPLRGRATLRIAH